MKPTELFKEFFHSEKAGGLVLIGCTILSLIITNFFAGEAYGDFWHMNISGLSLEHWINDGLMAIFFLLIGLELERELYIGELSKLKDALLPIFAALGGMLIPAGIFLLLNFGSPTSSGAGIPMATDIAFALGVLSLLGNKVPLSLKVFLTALAVIDDLGAIMVIAIFYSKSIVLTNLLISLGVFAALLVLNRLKVFQLWLYLIGGIVMWYFMLQSGVHATITGVLLAFAVPFGNGDERSPSFKLQHILHYPVAFVILPIFALANTAIQIRGDNISSFDEPYMLGIALGLIVGKPLGILIFTILGEKLGLCKIPEDLNRSKILGAGFLGGIGFTMSIFIALLAFEESVMINNAKLVILLSSLVAGYIGLMWLKKQLK